MQLIGVFISWPFVVIAIVVLICIVIYYGYRRGEKGLRFLTLTLGEIFVAFIAWQILFVVFRFCTYTGGSAEEILLKHSVSNIAAYLVVFVILIFFENKRASSLKLHEASS